MNKYFYRDTKENFSYIKIPKAFFTDEKYKKISPEAKFLYSILLDRMCLSQSNGWYDDDGRVYIIFTVKEIMDAMGCADRKVKRLMDELEEKCDLIERKRRGQGKPSFIYVKTFESAKQRLQNRQNNDSRVVKSTVQESSEQRCNNTDINKTDYSKTDINKSFYSFPSESGSEDERTKYRKIIKNNIEYDILSARNPCSKEELDEIVGLMLDTVCSKKEYIRVGGDNKPGEVVKGQLLKLGSEHIEYCMECLKNNTTDVRNVRQYLLTTLYNAPLTVSHYYGLKVNHDMAYGADVRYG